MKNTTLLALVAIVVVIAGYFVFANLGSSSNSSTASGGDIQKITLSFRNYNYYPNIITVNANQPVEITLDSSVGGCYRSFTIPALGISQYSKAPTNKITFTPAKKGTFTFACSMGMGTGTIIVQ